MSDEAVEAGVTCYQCGGPAEYIDTLCGECQASGTVELESEPEPEPEPEPEQALSAQARGPIDPSQPLRCQQCGTELSTDGLLVWCEPCRALVFEQDGPTAVEVVAGAAAEGDPDSEPPSDPQLELCPVTSHPHMWAGAVCGNCHCPRGGSGHE